MKTLLTLSPLGHTWFIDLDGTVLKHNGYLAKEGDALLPGVKDFFDQIPASDKIVLISSRKVAYKEQTLTFLVKNGIRFDTALFDMPMGERILINDQKPSGLETAYAVGPSRDEGLAGVAFKIDNKK